MSVAIVAAAAAVIIGGTSAFFSDTETSAGNTFSAGALDLTIDSEQHYNGNTCVNIGTAENPNYVWQGDADYPVAGTACDGTWALTDLGDGVHKFFNFADVKPGDNGENTISMHVNNNDAWACIDIDLTANDDMSSTEPELAVDTAEDAGNTFDGELAQNIYFAAWLDQGNTPGWQGDADAGEGDNVWQGQAAEPLLFSNQSGPASDVLGGKTYTLADSTTPNGPITGGQTNYIGLAWCAGTQVVNTGAGTITCDGSTLGNIVQTDSFVADIAFRVEQARNNGNFVCGEPNEEEPGTGTLTVDKIVSFSSTAIAGVDVTDFQLTIDGPGAPQVVTDEVPTPGLPAGVYTISESYSGNPPGITFNAAFSGACSEVGDTGVGTMTLNEGDDVTCTITNTVSPTTTPTSTPSTQVKCKIS